MELASWFKSRCVEAVYSSPLSRCMETAEYIAGEQQRVHVEEGLVELDAGEWENMEFTEIRSRYPQLYEERGRSIGTVPPPGGESFARGAERLQDALNRILGNTRGDVAVVTHCGVSRGLMCGILGWDINRVLEVPQPYGGISRILADDDGGFRGFYEQTGVKPLLYPDHGICRRLSDRYSVPEHIRLHEAAVARLAHQWAVRLKRLGYDIDPELLRTAGLLHDIARLKPDHARAGARILRMEGYPVMAGIIQCHHRLEGGEESGLTERTLLFLADKMTLEDRMVDIDERFRQSAPKCTTPPARAAISATSSGSSAMMGLPPTANRALAQSFMVTVLVMQWMSGPCSRRAFKYCPSKKIAPSPHNFGYKKRGCTRLNAPLRPPR